MKQMLLFLTAALLALGTPALADVIVTENTPTDEEVSPVRVDPFHAGALEIVPVMSIRFSSGAMVYRAGISVGYSLTRSHQIGGSFVMGNRVWDRARPTREVVDITSPGFAGTPTYLSVDEGFGSSLTGFYRYNIPYMVKKQTYPFLEVFGGRDFGWGDVKELGAGAGVRKFVSRRTAVTSQYAFTALFAGGQRVARHVISAGVSVFFR